MPEETDKLKWKLDQILASSDSEWIDAVTATVNAMYKQFEVERHGEKKVSPFDAAAPKLQRAFFVKQRSHDRPGANSTEPGFVLLIF
jgi:hypothetical protein